MARIRTVKPDFYRHEGLQDLEASNPGYYCMLVFSGLWGHCDKSGRFEWKPRMLKLDILPFLEFSMEETLSLLDGAKFVRRYTVGGREYGVIESFAEHQRIGGKEAQEPSKFPEPPSINSGSNGEAEVKQQVLQEGKGREKEGKGSKPPKFSPELLPLPVGLSDAKWLEWLNYRRARRLTMLEPTIRKQLEMLADCQTRGHPAAEIIDLSISSGWQGLFEPKARGSQNQTVADKREEVSMVLTGRGKQNANEHDITGQCERVA